MPRIGLYYKLTREVKYESQDHHFTFPVGTVLRLDDIFAGRDHDVEYVEDEDGETVPVYTEVPVTRYLFESVPQGYCVNLAPVDVTLASAAEVSGAAPTVVHHEPCHRVPRLI